MSSHWVTLTTNFECSGDIEDILKTIAFVKGHKWTSLMIKRVYFGNWLRDYSQAYVFSELIIPLSNHMSDPETGFGEIHPSNMFQFSLSPKTGKTDQGLTPRS